MIAAAATITNAVITCSFMSKGRGSKPRPQCSLSTPFVATGVVPAGRIAVRLPARFEGRVDLVTLAAHRFLALVHPLAHLGAGLAATVAQVLPAVIQAGHERFAGLTATLW